MEIQSILPFACSITFANVLILAYSIATTYMHINISGSDMQYISEYQYYRDINDGDMRIFSYRGLTNTKKWWLK